MSRKFDYKGLTTRESSSTRLTCLLSSLSCYVLCICLTGSHTHCGFIHLLYIQEKRSICIYSSLLISHDTTSTIASMAPLWSSSPRNFTTIPPLWYTFACKKTHIQWFVFLKKLGDGVLSSPSWDCCEKSSWPSARTAPYGSPSQPSTVREAAESHPRSFGETT